MHVIELTTFTPSVNYKKDPAATFAGLADVLKSAPGFQSIYHGIHVEDPNQAYMVTLWDSVESHESLMKSDLAVKGRAALGPILTDPPQIEMTHINARNDPLPALQSGVTEVNSVTAKPGCTISQVVEAMDALFGGGPPQTSGLGVEQPDTHFAFIGWDSVEAHTAMFEKIPQEIQPMVNSFLSVSEVTAKHVALQKA